MDFRVKLIITLTVYPVKPVNINYLFNYASRVIVPYNSTY